MRTFLSLFACLTISVTAAERIPGTQVTMDPPKAFVPSPGFNGYMNETTGASLMVVEMPGPYKEVIKGMTAEQMKPRGMELLSSEEVKIGEVEGKLLLVRLKAHGTTFKKWLLIFGTEKTVMIHGTAEEAKFDKISDGFRKSMLGASWDPEVEVGILEALPFTVEEAEDLKFSFKMANGVVLTQDGKHPQPEIEKPLVLVSFNINPQFKADTNPKTVAHAMKKSMSSIPKDMKVAEEKTVQIGGKDGYRIKGTAKPRGAKGQITYELNVMIEEGRMVMMFARVATDSLETYQPLFETIRGSIKLK